MPNWMRIAIQVAATVIVGCGQQPPDDRAAEKAKADNGEWWCNEHGVPKDECGMCDEQIAIKIKKEERCPKHSDRTRGQCFTCDPEKWSASATRYQERYPGKQPPEPSGDNKLTKVLLSFKQLHDESWQEPSRKALIGTRVSLRGQFVPAGRIGSKEFSLVRLGDTCCSVCDEPFRARVVTQNADDVANIPLYSWVSVSGVIAEFAQTVRGEWVAIIQADTKGVKLSESGQ